MNSISLTKFFDGRAVLRPLCQAAAAAILGLSIMLLGGCGDSTINTTPQAAAVEGGGQTISAQVKVPSSGTFKAPILYPTGGNVTYGAIGDIDGDGYPDITVVYDRSNELAVLLGQPGSAFSKPISVGFGLIFAHVLADLDGDGLLDIVGTDGATGVVLLNRSGPGQVMFKSALRFQTPGPESLVVGDVDGDGRPDLVISASGTGDVNIFLGLGGGQFAPPFVLPVPSFAVALGDMDGDGHVDIVTANPSVNTVSLFRNRSGPGNLSFSPRQDIAAGIGPREVALGDLNGDGWLDVVVPNYNTVTAGQQNQSISVLLGKGGKLAPAKAYMIIVNRLLGPQRIRLGDINGDGRLDALVQGDYTGSWSALGDGRGGFGAGNPQPMPGAFTNFFELYDLNRDGMLDIAQGNRVSNLPPYVAVMYGR